MAAFLKFTPGQGAFTTADLISRLCDAEMASLSIQARARPTLVCRWQQEADGRLFCHWEADVPDIPIPPH
ncbi:MAG: hypothetical protein JO227_18900 [Acetobacteraceae bacterium]|nr:hypothetical protein [Acetobacteraceae bacterium]